MRCHCPRTTTDSRSVTDAAASRAAVGELVASSSSAPSPRPAPNPVERECGTDSTRAPAATSRASTPPSTFAARMSTTSPGREQRNRLGVRDPHRRGDETRTEPAQRRRPHQADVGEHLSPAYRRDHRPTGRLPRGTQRALRHRARRATLHPHVLRSQRGTSGDIARSDNDRHTGRGRRRQRVQCEGHRAGQQAGCQQPSSPGHGPAGLAQPAVQPGGCGVCRPGHVRPAVTAGRTGASGRRSRAGTSSRRPGRGARTVRRPEARGPR